MFDTPLGLRVLHGLERTFFIDILGQLVDELVCANSEYVHDLFNTPPEHFKLSVPLMDKLTLGQILHLLRKISAALLYTNVKQIYPAPHYDSAHIYIFQYAHILLNREEETYKNGIPVMQRAEAKNDSVKLKLQKAIVYTIQKFSNRSKAMSDMLQEVAKLQWDVIGELDTWHLVLDKWMYNAHIMGKTVKEREQKILYLTANESLNFGIFQKRLTQLYVTSIPNSLNDSLMKMNEVTAKAEHEILIAFTYTNRVVDKASSVRIEEILKKYVYENVQVLHNCEWCLKQEEYANQFQWCGQCVSVCYCSPDCQKLHWFSAPPRYETHQDVQLLLNDMKVSTQMAQNSLNLSQSSSASNTSRISRRSSTPSILDSEVYRLVKQMGPHRLVCKPKVNPS